jgi:hypothetical protein
MDQELFRYLPENNWPPSFLEYLTTMQGKQVQPAFYPQKPEQLRAIASFGNKIWSTFLDVKQTITNKYHPHWDEVEKNRSGNSMSAFLESIRDKAWRSTLDAKAKASLRNKRNYAASRDKPTVSSTFEEILQKMIEEGNTTYDTEWLSFLLLGKPSPEPLECFNLSHHSKKKFDLTTAIDESKDYMKKGARREARREGRKNQDQSTTPNSPGPIEIVLAKDDDEELINNCKEMISLLERREGNEDEIEEYYNMIMLARKAKIQNLAKKRGLTQSNTTPEKKVKLEVEDLTS